MLLCWVTQDSSSEDGQHETTESVDLASLYAAIRHRPPPIPQLHGVQAAGDEPCTAIGDSCCQHGQAVGLGGARVEIDDHDLISGVADSKQPDGCSLNPEGLLPQLRPYQLRASAVSAHASPSTTTVLLTPAYTPNCYRALRCVSGREGRRRAHHSTVCDLRRQRLTASPPELRSTRALQPTP